MKNKTGVVAVTFLILALAGCATSRSVLDVATPIATSAAQPNGKTVFINLPKDNRIFEVSPSSPIVPSLDPSEVQNQSIKARAVGRKRNSYGKALGDIVLKENQSIESLTAASLRKAFTEKGYKVIESRDQVSNETYMVDTDVDKFWSWMNPGFWSITLSSEISTGLTIKSSNGTERHIVTAKAADNYQVAVDANWMEVMNKALTDYVERVKAVLK
jgi:uncharacterized lipoprotein YajG